MGTLPALNRMRRVMTRSAREKYLERFAQALESAHHEPCVVWVCDAVTVKSVLVEAKRQSRRKRPKTYYTKGHVVGYVSLWFLCVCVRDGCAVFSSYHSYHSYQMAMLGVVTGSAWPCDGGRDLSSTAVYPAAFAKALLRIWMACQSG